MSKYTLSALILFSLFSCRSNVKDLSILKGNPIQIDILHSPNLEVKNISTDLGSTELLKFKAADSTFFLASVKKLVVYNNDYYVLDDRLSNLCRFDSSGNLLNTFGTVGLGENEYSKITDFDIDFGSNTVVIMSTENTSLFYYTLSGTLLKRKQVGIYGTGFISLDDGDNIFYRNFSGGTKGKGYNIITTDSNGYLHARAFPHDPNISDVAWESTGFLRKENGKTLFAQAFSDTVFEFINNTLLPLFNVSIASNNLSARKVNHRKLLSQQILLDSSTSYLCSQFFVNKRIAVFNYQQDKKIRTSIFDFATKTAKTISPNSPDDPLLAMLLTPIFLDEANNLFLKFDMKNVLFLKIKSPALFNSLPGDISAVLTNESEHSGAFILKVKLKQNLFN